MSSSTRGNGGDSGPDASSSTGPAIRNSRPSANRPLRGHFYSIGSFRFRFSREHVIDTIMDGLSWVVERLVYVIGPLLILLALSIMSLLTYSFATILLPMIQAKHEGSALRHLYTVLHSLLVAFILFNVLFNYFYCVMTRHSGPNYDRLVRELAEATGVTYPETPVQVAQYRRDFEDKMVLRMRRQQARTAEAQVIPPVVQVDGGAVTQRKHPVLAPSGDIVNNNGTTVPSTRPLAPPRPPVRRWMLLGPFEWGYCGNSNQPKPPRSHFDHVSHQLVLNLDHYCPWMFNAIGYFNYRYFVAFLIYIFAGMLYGATITLQPFLLLSSEEYKEQVRVSRRGVGLARPVRFPPMLPYRDEKTLLTLSFMLCMAVGVAVLMLGGFHVYLTLTAQTTVEFHGNFANRKRAKRLGQKWHNPYSLDSCRANFEQVFGRRSPWLFALLPSAREPEFFPYPVPGHTRRRGPQQNGVAQTNGESIEATTTTTATTTIGKLVQGEEIV